jgi:hypothetical protein
LSIDFKKAKSLKEFPKEIPNGFSNGFKTTRNLPLGSFLGTCLPVVTYQSTVSATQVILASGDSRKE